MQQRRSRTALFAALTASLLMGAAAPAEPNDRAGTDRIWREFQLAQNEDDDEEDDDAATGASATVPRVEYEGEPQRESVAETARPEADIEENGKQRVQHRVPGAGAVSVDDMLGPELEGGTTQQPSPFTQTPGILGSPGSDGTSGRSDCEELLQCLGGVKQALREGSSRWEECAKDHDATTVKIAQSFARCVAACEAQSCTERDCDGARQRCAQN